MDKKTYEAVLLFLRTIAKGSEARPLSKIAKECFQQGDVIWEETVFFNDDGFVYQSELQPLVTTIGEDDQVYFSNYDAQIEYERAIERIDCDLGRRYWLGKPTEEESKAVPWHYFHEETVLRRNQDEA